MKPIHMESSSSGSIHIPCILFQKIFFIPPFLHAVHKFTFYMLPIPSLFYIHLAGRCVDIYPVGDVVLRDEGLVEETSL